MSPKSIFIPSFGNRPEQIVGRDTIIAEFADGLSQPVGHKKRASLIVGQRGFGKTALLLEFASLAAKMDYITARVTASNQMLDEIIEIIQREGAQFVPRQRHRVKGFSAGALGFTLGLSFSEEAERQYGFRSKLTLLCDELALHGKKILILVDEVQPSDEAMRTLATTYQHLVGEKREIAIVMAGLPSSMSSVLNDSILTFLNRAHRIYLGPLPLGEISIYYAQVFRELGRPFDPSALDVAVSATRGYPYLLQLMGYYLANYSEDCSQVSLDMVTQAAAASRQEMIANIFEPVLKPLSNRDRDFLKAMAKDTAASTMADIAARLKVSKPYAQKYRRRLIEAGIIAPGGRGEVEIVIPYLSEHLRGEF
jgi:AcrR family transcriptional regulator